MTPEEARAALVARWMQKAADALASARSELAAGRIDFAVNRAYYACFYSSSAVLLKMGRRFVKHTGVRTAIHEHMVKTGLLEKASGQLFSDLFHLRHRADYEDVEELSAADVEKIIAQADSFVEDMKRLIEPKG